VVKVFGRAVGLVVDTTLIELEGWVRSVNRNRNWSDFGKSVFQSLKMSLRKIILAEFFTFSFPSGIILNPVSSASR
jgi:hypothetical protein